MTKTLRLNRAGARLDPARAPRASVTLELRLPGGATLSEDRQARAPALSVSASSERPVICLRLLDPEQRERRRRDVGEDALAVQRRPRPAVTTNGTGLSECAVSGEPSSSSISSALPWSAVTMQAPPLAWTASTIRPRHSSTVSTAVTAAAITPVWPTMSALAKLMIAKREVLLGPVAQERLGRLARAHLRLVVVGRHVARRRHELAHLAVVRLLLAAVEEVRHVRVLLRLGDVQLGAAGVGDHLAERDRRPVRREHDRERPVLVVLRQRRVRVDDLGQRRRDLAHPVGAEVEREHGVAGADPRLLADRRRR